MKLGDMLQQCLEGELAAGRSAAVLDAATLELCFAPRPGSAMPPRAPSRQAECRTPTLLWCLRPCRTTKRP